MKAIFRFLSFGLLALTFGVVSGSGQQPAAAVTPTPDPACADVDGQTAAYTKVTDNYNKKTVPEMEAALAAGKEFLEKYGACETLKAQVDFVKPHVARLEKDIPITKARIELAPFFTRFDAGIIGDNADEVYAAGKEILARQPENLNIIVPMGVVGMYQSTPANNFKYADDGIRYANMALAKIKAGAPFIKKDKAGVEVVGALKYEYKKQEAIDDLTYSVAYLTYYGKKDKKTALPLYYELSQSSGRYKDDPRIYGTIGDHYVEESAPIGKEIVALIEKIKTAPTDEEKEKLNTDTKAKVALYNGYTERALDAFSRAHKVAKSDTPAAKTYKDNLYKIMQGLYKRRFDKDTGVDAYIAATLAKPFPNPTSEVTPIADPEPVTTTTTTTGQPATASPATANPAAAVKKPESAVIQKPAVVTAPVKTPAASTVAIKTKPAVKKPVVRRKGKG